MTIAALVLSTLAPLEADVRSAALLGIALSSASGGLALMLKRRGLSQGEGMAAVKNAMKAVAIVFALRAVLMAVGLWVVARAGGGEFAFVAGFFGVYLIQQCVELSYVFAVSKTALPVKS